MIGIGSVCVHVKDLCHFVDKVFLVWVSGIYGLAIVIIIRLVVIGGFHLEVVTIFTDNHGFAGVCLFVISN